MDEISVYVSVVLVSTVVFSWTTHKLSVRVATHFSPEYSKLSHEQSWIWRSGFTSVVNALFMGLASVYILMTETLHEDVYWSDSYLTRLASCVEIGYFIADTIVLLFYEKPPGMMTYLFHHIACIVGCSIAVFLQAFAFLICTRGIAEFSTPFMHFRRVLSSLKLHDRPIYIWNGIAFAVTFFICRLAILPVNYYVLIPTLGSYGYYRVNVLCRIPFLLSMAVLDILNVFWFSLIMKICYKTMKKMLWSKQYGQ